MCGREKLNKLKYIIGTCKKNQEFIISRSDMLCL